MFQRFVNWFKRTIGIDRLLHFLVEAIIVFTLTSYGIPVWIAAIIGLAIGIIKEIIDARTGGKFDIIDLMADIVGIGYVWFVLWSNSFVG